jgi:hypothetical protein
MTSRLFWRATTDFFAICTYPQTIFYAQAPFVAAFLWGLFCLTHTLCLFFEQGHRL